MQVYGLFKHKGMVVNLCKRLFIVCLVCVLAGEAFAVEAPAQQPSPNKTILILGDSLSAAYKLSAKQGWASLMQARLREEGLRYQVVNASISGATSAAGLQLLPRKLHEHKPSVVILELGANDGLQGKPVSYISQNLKRLIQLAKDANAQVLLLGIRLPPNFGSKYTEPFFQQYALLAKDLEANLVPFMLDGVAGKPEYMLSDGLHPNAEGQVLVLDTIWPYLQVLLGK